MRASRCAARWAEPLFLLTGAALQRVRTFCENAEKRQNATTNRNAAAFRARRADKTRNFRFRRQLGSEVGRFGALPAAPGRLYWRPGTHRAATGGAPGLRPGRPEGTARRSWDVSGAPWVAREGTEVDVGRFRLDVASIFGKIFVAFRGCFTRASRCAARPQRRAPTRKARFGWLDWPTARQAGSIW